MNPHWEHRHPNGRELRIVVPDEPWEDMIREATPPGVRVNVACVNLPDLHQGLTQAIGEGRGPDLAVLDSVRVPELGAAGFLHAVDELAPGWLRDDYEADVVRPFVEANRFASRTVAVQAEADVAGIWFRRGDLAAAGLEPPATWDELVATGRALAEAKHPSHARRRSGSIGPVFAGGRPEREPRRSARESARGTIAARMRAAEGFSARRCRARLVLTALPEEEKWIGAKS